MQGFYAINYHGNAGRGAFGALLKDGKVYAVDPTGGDVSGTYTATADGGVNLDVVFFFKKGGFLVTGQAVTTDMKFPAIIALSAATLAGGSQMITLPFGQVTAKVEKKLTL